MTLALGAIPVRVFGDYAEEARALLIEAEANATDGVSEPLSDRVAKAGLGFLGLVPPPRLSAEIVG